MKAPAAAEEGEDDDKESGAPVDRRLAPIWTQLKVWVVEEHGGYVHPGLNLVRCLELDRRDEGEADDAPSPPQPQGDPETEAAESKESVAAASRAPSVDESMPVGNTAQLGASRTRSDNAQDDDDGDWKSHRGIVATQFIAKGTMLVRLPARLALGSTNRPNQLGSMERSNIGIGSNGSLRDVNNDGRSGSVAATSPTLPQGSPWLECLIKVYRVQQRQQQGKDEPINSTTNPVWDPYVDSLPASYDTLLDWTDDHLRYLAGTNLGEDCCSRQRQRQVLRDRYTTNVRPRLVERNLLSNVVQDSEDEFERFLMACQAISTRCFYLDDDDATLSSSSISNRNALMGESSAGTTFGPCFLPVIDLLNHCSDDSRKVTTLKAVKRRDATLSTLGSDETVGDENDIVCFEMRAERDVKAGDAVTHSYFGTNTMTSEQCLRTFGFVEASAVRKAANAAASICSSLSTAATTTSRARQTSSNSSSLTPAVLSKELVLTCCRRTVEKERQSREIAHAVAHQSSPQHVDDDETWELPSPEAFLLRDLASLPEHIVVSATDLLPNDLVTLLCLPFLPNDAYEELIESPSGGISASPQAAVISTLDPTVLDDPYLGQLVGKTILDLVKEKAGTYGPIRIGGVVVDLDDRALLRELLHIDSGRRSSDDNEGTGSSAPVASMLRTMDPKSRQRLGYGLTLRLEEQTCLEALRRAAIRILLRATGGDECDDDIEVYDQTGSEPSDAKRRRSSSA